MITFDNERMIMDFFHSIETEEILFDNENKKNIDILESIYLQENWQKWVDSSSKAAPPPDFYCDELKLMMEVMRVDDHAYINEKGKSINPTLARENEKKKILEKMEIPEHVNLVLNVDTGLPTCEDHNYKFYYENFKRVIDKHNGSAEMYRKNHPNYKLIFFIFDESCNYAESLDERVDPKNTVLWQVVDAKPHVHFADKIFLDVIKNCKADYLIWFADNKIIQTPEGYCFPPKAVVYKIDEIKMTEMLYNEKNMVSTEI